MKHPPPEQVRRRWGQRLQNSCELLARQIALEKSAETFVTEPRAFLHEILRLTRHDNQPDYERLTIAYIYFESQLRTSLFHPRYNTSIPEFIEQLEGKKHAWYETLYHSGKKKDHLPTEPSPSRQGNDQRPPQRQQQWSRSSATQQQWPRNTMLQPTNSTRPPNLGPQQQQRLPLAPLVGFMLVLFTFAPPPVLSFQSHKPPQHPIRSSTSTHISLSPYPIYQSDPFSRPFAIRHGS